MSEKIANEAEISLLAAQTEVLRKIAPSLDTSVFAIGNTCVAAIHYQALYEGMGPVTFAAFREDYDAVLERLVQACGRIGLQCDHEVEVGGKLFSKPYARVGDGQAWINFYPLDEIPYQTILRFAILKESKKAMTLYKRMEETQGFSGIAEFSKLAKALRRYEGIGSGVRTCLFSRPEGGFAGERTIFQKSMEEGNLLPVRFGEISGIKVPLPAKVGNWTTELNDSYDRILSTVQRENLDSMVKLDAACKEAGIDYFLVGGSMLGAVRHHGFIPWDDDVDVGMLRSDYKRFVKEIERHIGPEFMIQLPSTDPHIHFAYARLRKANPQYITYYNHDKDFNKGLWIDAFPFDAMPKTGVMAKVQRKLAFNFARTSSGFKRRREYAIADLKTDLSKLPAADRAKLKRYRFASRFFPVALCRLGYHVSARFFNPIYGRGANARFASFIPSYTTISRSEALPVKVVDYEGARLANPNGAEAFLTRQYGDFMSLPPIHERYTEHGFKCLILEDGEILEP
ncbi:MAG: LicD family protein [Coriobacteriales bacterium]|nr:LicD family protein [Coriobacteriales bacterium]